MKRSCIPPTPDPLSQLVEEAIRRSIRDQKKLLHKELSTGPSLKRSRSKSDTAKEAAAAARTRQKARDVMSAVLSEVAVSVMSDAASVVDAATVTDAPNVTDASTGTATDAPPVASAAASVEDSDTEDWENISPACAQIANDEVLARACELMGSSLFESALSEAEKGERKPTAVADDDGKPSPEVLYEAQLRQLQEVGLLERYSKVKVSLKDPQLPPSKPSHIIT